MTTITKDNTRTPIGVVVTIIAISAVASLFLCWLVYYHPPADVAGTHLLFLPALNAFLNGLSAIALVAGFFPLGEVAKLVNIGVLSAFIVICSAVLVLRRRKPDLPRAFRTPWVPVIPVTGIIFSVWLLSELAAITWMVFLIWVALGALVYFGYGMRHSKLAPDAVSASVS